MNHQTPSDVLRYLSKKSSIPLTAYTTDFERILSSLRRFRHIDANTRILEVGTGTGWFTTLCALRGIHCRGIDISPELIEHAKALARQSGVQPEFEAVGLESGDLGKSAFDFVVADSVFEHVRDWRTGVRAIYDALKPGGVLFFISTNKWCLKSGEFRFPLYGWLPDGFRYRLRAWFQGPDIMELGIDFHQFTFWNLRRAFLDIGFSRVYDRVDRAELDDVPSALRRTVLRICKRSVVAKHLALTFYPVTDFLCIR